MIEIVSDSLDRFSKKLVDKAIFQCSNCQATLSKNMGFEPVTITVRCANCRHEFALKTRVSYSYNFEWEVLSENS